MLLPKMSARSDEQRQLDAERSLLQMEAKIGGELFGPVPKGHSRQFFCLNERTWIWHEVGNDTNGKQRLITTRYDVRPGGVLKSQDGQTYQRLSLDEARNLHRAMRLYRQRVTAEYQHMMQAA